MKDEITINIRALNEEIIAKLIKMLDEQLNDVPDATNEEALEILGALEGKKHFR